MVPVGVVVVLIGLPVDCDEGEGCDVVGTTSVAGRYTTRECQRRTLKLVVYK